MSDPYDFKLTTKESARARHSKRMTATSSRIRPIIIVVAALVVGVMVWILLSTMTSLDIGVKVTITGTVLAVVLALPPLWSSLLSNPRDIPVSIRRESQGDSGVGDDHDESAIHGDQHSQNLVEVGRDSANNGPNVGVSTGSINYHINTLVQLNAPSMDHEDGASSDPSGGRIVPSGAKMDVGMDNTWLALAEHRWLCNTGASGDEVAFPTELSWLHEIDGPEHFIPHRTDERILDLLFGYYQQGRSDLEGWFRAQVGQPKA